MPLWMRRDVEMSSWRTFDDARSFVRPVRVRDIKNVLKRNDVIPSHRERSIDRSIVVVVVVVIV